MPCSAVQCSVFEYAHSADSRSSPNFTYTTYTTLPYLHIHYTPIHSPTFTCTTLPTLSFTNLYTYIIPTSLHWKSLN